MSIRKPRSPNKAHQLAISPEDRKRYNKWYQQVKNELLETEPQNISARVRCFENIINTTITTLCKELGLPSIPTNCQYTSDINPLDHLTFLTSWPGLRVENTDSVPKTQKEYEKKSKNWLNGRRAPNYGKTLFPTFIQNATKYGEKISRSLITKNETRRELFYNIFIYKILSQLCGCTVSLHEQAKKAPFFCKNSVERKCKLRIILQSYAKDHQYVQGFPSCFEEAVGYFDSKINSLINDYKEKFPYKQEMEPIVQIHENELNHSKQDKEFWKIELALIEEKYLNEKKLREKAEKELGDLKELLKNHSCFAEILKKENNVISSHQQRLSKPHLNGIPSLKSENNNQKNVKQFGAIDKQFIRFPNIGSSPKLPLIVGSIEEKKDAEFVYGNHRNMIPQENYYERESFDPIGNHVGFQQRWTVNDYDDDGNGLNTMMQNTQNDQLCFNGMSGVSNTFLANNIPLNRMGSYGSYNGDMMTDFPSLGYNYNNYSICNGNISLPLRTPSINSNLKTVSSFPDSIHSFEM